MPQLSINGFDRPLLLIPYDIDGNEQTASTSDRLTSQQAVDALGDQSVTDVFIISHGWNADFPSAVSQYTKWMGAMVACQNDINNLKARPSGFVPLPIGIHWPSLAFADNELGGPNVAAADFGFLDLISLVDDYATRLVGTATAVVSQARDAIGTIVNSAVQNLLPTSLPSDVVAAYNKLNQLASLVGNGDPADAPDADRLPPSTPKPIIRRPAGPLRPSATT